MKVAIHEHMVTNTRSLRLKHRAQVDAGQGHNYGRSLIDQSTGASPQRQEREVGREV